jgi:hypothetical protein
MPRPRPHDPLVAEPQQVLEVAAAAGDDDHLDGRVGVEPADRGDDLGRRAVALHRRVGGAELDCGPAEACVAQDVLLGVAVARRDEADHRGQEREPLLARGFEEALGGELPAQPLEPLEEVAEADVLHVVDLHRERAAPDPPARLGEQHRVVACLNCSDRRARTDDHMVNEIVASVSRSFSLP